MVENVSSEDFEKLTQAMAELSFMMCTGLQDIRRVVQTKPWEHHELVDQTMPMGRRHLGRADRLHLDSSTEEDLDLFDYS